MWFSKKSSCHVIVVIFVVLPFLGDTFARQQQRCRVWLSWHEQSVWRAAFFLQQIKAYGSPAGREWMKPGSLLGEVMSSRKRVVYIYIYTCVRLRYVWLSPCAVAQKSELMSSHQTSDTNVCITCAKGFPHMGFRARDWRIEDDNVFSRWFWVPKRQSLREKSPSWFFLTARPTSLQVSFFLSSHQ